MAVLYSRDHEGLRFPAKIYRPKTRFTIPSWCLDSVVYAQSSTDILSKWPEVLLTSFYRRLIFHWIFYWLPSDKHNSNATELVFSQFDITWVQHMPFGLQQEVECMLHHHNSPLLIWTGRHACEICDLLSENRPSSHITRITKIMNLKKE